jgi:hypothetical protein
MQTWVLPLLTPFGHGCFFLTRHPRNLVVLHAPLKSGAEAMSGVAKCRKRAHEILAQAERDPGHGPKLIAAAEGWLALASCLRRLEKSLQHRRPLAKEAASVDDIFHADLR